MTIAPVTVLLELVVLLTVNTSSVTMSVVVTVVYCIVNFSATISPPTYKLPPIPTPPKTCKAPDVVLKLFVEVVINNFEILSESVPELDIVTPPMSKVALLTNKVLNRRSALPKLNALDMLGSKSPVTVPLLITVPARVISVNVLLQ